MITSDQNLKYQQNLANRQLAVIQLPTNKMPLVIELAYKVRVAINRIGAGDFIEIQLNEQE